LADIITGGSGNDPTPPIGLYRSRLWRFFDRRRINVFNLSFGADDRVKVTRVSEGR